MPSGFELVVILVIVALIFGTKKLRGIGSDLGGAIKGFKSSMKESETDDKDEIIEAKVEAKDANKESFNLGVNPLQESYLKKCQAKGITHDKDGNEVTAKNAQSTWQSSNNVMTNPAVAEAANGKILIYDTTGSTFTTENIIVTYDAISLGQIITISNPLVSNISGENFFIYSFIFSIRALTEFTFQELIIIKERKKHHNHRKIYFVDLKF